MKETLKLAPGSSVFTAAALAFGLVLMIPTTFPYKLYKPNATMLKLGLGFIVVSLLYYFLYPKATDPNDLIYIAYYLIFLVLLISIPNEIIRDIIPVVILFTLASNLALIYSLKNDPYWTVGQRAFISYGTGPDGERSGNPHPFAKNALMGVVASFVWAIRDKTPTYVKALCILNGLFSLCVLILTVARSSYVAMGIIILLFFMYNVRGPQIRKALTVLKSPLSLIIMSCILGGALFFIRRNMDVLDIVLHYATVAFEKNLENVYALFGQRMNNQVVAFDASSAQRSISMGYVEALYYGNIPALLLGQGYKFMYLDIPLMEALINHGLFGFLLFGSMNFLLLYHSLNAISTNKHPLSTFLGYFYFYFFVVMFTNGRPYDYYLWFPYLFFIRFLGVENLLPQRLLNPNV